MKDKIKDVELLKEYLVEVREKKMSFVDFIRSKKKKPEASKLKTESKKRVIKHKKAKMKSIRPKRLKKRYKIKKRIVKRRRRKR